VNFSHREPDFGAPQISPPLRDASTGPVGFDQAMADRDRLRVTLELDIGSEPIAGSLHAHGSCLTFSGWLGLAAALEQAISSAGDGGQPALALTGRTQTGAGGSTDSTAASSPRE
jgi:hypothetical protein